MQAVARPESRLRCGLRGHGAPQGHLLPPPQAAVAADGVLSLSEITLPGVSSRMTRWPPFSSLRSVSVHHSAGLYCGGRHPQRPGAVQPQGAL